MSDALILRDDRSLIIHFTPAAELLKTTALEKSALIGRVTTADDQQQAVEAQKVIHDTLLLVDKARKAAKAPIIEFGNSIEAAAKRFTTELKEEQNRLATAVGDFVTLEQARVRAAEQLRLAEQRKLEQERRDREEQAMREALAEKAKLDTLAAEALKKAQLAADGEAKKKAELELLELSRWRKAAEAKSHDDLDRINEDHARAVADLPVAVPVRATGQRVRNEWEIEVVDIWALARAHSICVKIEPLLSEIKSLLDAGVKVAGVRANRVIKSGVTSGRPQPAIEA